MMLSNRQLILCVSSQEADEIKTIGQAVEYILKQPDGKYKVLKVCE